MCVSGLKQRAVSGLWSHQPVKVKSDSERDKADWHGNGICCLRAKRPDWLTALSLSSHPSGSSHHTILSSSSSSSSSSSYGRLCIPISEQNIGGAVLKKQVLFDDQDVKQCLCEKRKHESSCYLLRGTICLKPSLSLLVAFFLPRARQIFSLEPFLSGYFIMKQEVRSLS